VVISGWDSEVNEQLPSQEVMCYLYPDPNNLVANKKWFYFYLKVHEGKEVLSEK